MSFRKFLSGGSIHYSRSFKFYVVITVYSARWIECSDKKKLEEFSNKAVENLAVDGGGHLTYLAPTRVNLALMEERWPDVKFRATREHH